MVNDRDFVFSGNDGQLGMVVLPLAGRRALLALMHQLDYGWVAADGLPVTLTDQQQAILDLTENELLIGATMFDFQVKNVAPANPFQIPNGGVWQGSWAPSTISKNILIVSCFFAFQPGGTLTLQEMFIEKPDRTQLIVDALTDPIVVEYRTPFILSATDNLRWNIINNTGASRPCRAMFSYVALLPS